MLIERPSRPRRAITVRAGPPDRTVDDDSPGVLDATPPPGPCTGIVVEPTGIESARVVEEWLPGDGDPQDPPANLSAIPLQQPNARIVVMPAQQHTVGHSGCAPQVIAAFVDSATTKGLDTTCIERAEVPGLSFVLP